MDANYEASKGAKPGGAGGADCGVGAQCAEGAAQWVWIVETHEPSDDRWTMRDVYLTRRGASLAMDKFEDEGLYCVAYTRKLLP